MAVMIARRIFVAKAAASMPQLCQLVGWFGPRHFDAAPGSQALPRTTPTLERPRHDRDHGQHASIIQTAIQRSLEKPLGAVLLPATACR